MYHKNYISIPRYLTKRNYIFNQKRNLFLCISKYNQNIEGRKINVLNKDKGERMKTKILNNISCILKKELQKRKFLLILTFSILAISIDIRYVTCDHVPYSKKNLNGDVASNKDDIDADEFKLRFEELDEVDAFYFLKHKKKMHMIQYSANSPIEDRCFIYNININSDDLEKRKGAIKKGNATEKEFVDRFEASLRDKNEENEKIPKEDNKIDEVKDEKKELQECKNENNLFNEIFENDSKCFKNDNYLDNFLFAGVIDGHGGGIIAEIAKRSLGHYVKKQLIEKMKKEKKQTLEEKDIISSLEEAYLNLDNDILKNVKEFFYKGHIKYSRIGACCLSVLIDKNNYYISNVGDSKGLLARKNGYIPLNNIHNANQVSERKKLLEEHPNEQDIVLCKKEKEKEKEKFQMLNVSGKINKLLLDNYDHCYVKGRLQPTRNLGDFYLKHKAFAFDYINKRYIVNTPHSFPYINAKPEVLKVKKNADDEFIILMTDGVSDFLEETEVIDIVKRHINKSVEKASKAVIQNVLKKAASQANISMEQFLNVLPEYKRRLYDDMSIVIIKLNED